MDNIAYFAITLPEITHEKQIVIQTERRWDGTGWDGIRWMRMGGERRGGRRQEEEGRGENERYLLEGWRVSEDHLESP